MRAVKIGARLQPLISCFIHLGAARPRLDIPNGADRDALADIEIGIAFCRDWKGTDPAWRVQTDPGFRFGAGVTKGVLKKRCAQKRCCSKTPSIDSGQIGHEGMPIPLSSKAAATRNTSAS